MSPYDKDLLSFNFYKMHNQASCFEFLTYLLMGFGQNSSTLVHRRIFVLCIDSFDFKTEKDCCVLAETVSILLQETKSLKLLRIVRW